jgi:hypothetical protein
LKTRDREEASLRRYFGSPIVVGLRPSFLPELESNLEGVILESVELDKLATGN